MSSNKSLRKIDNLLNFLNETQLRELNKKIVEKLKIISKAKQLQAMSQFNIMDKAFFMDHGEKIVGTITKLNQKTVTFYTENGDFWNISPSLLTKIIDI